MSKIAPFPRQGDQLSRRPPQPTSRELVREHEIDNMMMQNWHWLILLTSLAVFAPYPPTYAQEYVPLNSLTISSLYKEPEDESLTSTEKAWWTDLQEQREIYKASKLREQQLKINNGKIIPMKLNAAMTTASQGNQAEATEFPMPLEQGTEKKPNDVVFPQGMQTHQIRTSYFFIKN